MLGAVCLLACSACGSETTEPACSGKYFRDMLRGNPSSKLDLLLVIDDSGSMVEEAQWLPDIVVDAVREMVAPPCRVDGLRIDETVPPDQACPEGSWRDAALNDVHVGVLGTTVVGLDVLASTLASQTRLRETPADGAALPTHLGVLGYDPEQLQSPPGLDDYASFESTLRELVKSVVPAGSGIEMPLESWYRFLVEPAPFARLERVPCDDDATEDCARALGTDALVLDQRAAFLRPDSLLLIAVVTDEDDCSFALDGQRWADLTTTCEVERRDALRPLARYGAALDARSVCDAGGCFENPIYADPPGFVGVRDRSLVHLSIAAGVPWQDLAREQDPDADPPDRAPDWSNAAIDRRRLLVGDLASGEPPDDPLMRLSTEPRWGKNPLTGDAVAQPDAQGPLPNPMNGHEHLTFDLQYACITRLPEAAVCPDGDSHCASRCDDSSRRDPVCQDPDTGEYGSQIRFASASPSPRLLELAIAETSTSSNASVHSICLPNLDQPELDDYGLRALLPTDRLVSSASGGLCAPDVAVEGDPSAPDFGRTPCVVVDLAVRGDPECSCSGRARSPLRPEIVDVARSEFTSRFCRPGEPCEVPCACEITQADGDALDACLDEAARTPRLPDGSLGDGWCYVNPERGVGNPTLVENCRATSRRLFRFVGAGRADLTLVMCSECN